MDTDKHDLAASHVVAAIDLGAFEESAATHRGARFAFRRLTKLSVLDQMLRRLAECLQVDEVVITGCNLPPAVLTLSTPLADIVDLQMPHSVQRLAAVADRTGADWILYLTGNRPFLDPVMIDSLVASARKLRDCDYVSYAGRDRQHETVCQIGLAGEMIHADCLRTMRRYVERLPADGSLGNLANCICNAPGAFQMRLLPLRSELDRSDLRFIIENEHDLQLAETIMDAIGEQRTDWQFLCDLVESHPEIREMMRKQNHENCPAPSLPSNLSLSAQPD
jgi:spore coat polysaccharide biosynthesis protein SpsF (cytidylyltransferase family)